MIMIDKAQKKRAPRFPLRFPIHYRKSGMLHWQHGRTVNISRTGVLLHTEEILKNNLTLEIRISLPQKAVISCHGTVVRTETGESNNSTNRLAVRMNHCRLLSLEKAQEAFK